MKNIFQLDYIIIREIFKYKRVALVQYRTEYGLSKYTPKN